MHPKTTLLARIRKIIEAEVPSNPDASQYRLSDAPGTGRAHRRRAKFLQRFRLFYRFRSGAKIIVYVWMNGESTLRTAGAKSDVYEVFKKVLNSGNPPDVGPLSFARELPGKEALAAPRLFYGP